MPWVIRRLTQAEYGLAFPVIHELRGHLDEAEYLARTERMAHRYGYELYAAFDETGVVVGAMGLRPLEGLARGWHIHVDDLVTSAAAQGSGVGTALLAFADEEAKRRGMKIVYLDSRPTAETFYLKIGFQRNAALGMNRPIV